MQKKLTKILSVILSALMLITAIPLVASADTLDYYTSNSNLTLSLVENTDDYTIFNIIAESGIVITACDLEINYDSSVFSSCEYAKQGQTLIDIILTGDCITAANFSTAGIIKIAVAVNDKYTTDVDTEFYTIKLIKVDNTKSSNITLSGDFSDILSVPVTNSNLWLSINENTDTYTIIDIIAKGNTEIKACDLTINYDSSVFSSCEYVTEGDTLRDLCSTGDCITAENFSTVGIINIGVAANDKYTTDVDTVFYTIKLIKADNTKDSNITLNGSFYDTLKIPLTHFHSYSFTITSNATCCNEGKLTYSCDCGNTYTEVIGMSKHIDEDNNGFCDNCSINLSSESKLKLAVVENTADYTIINIIAESGIVITACNLEINYDSSVFSSCEYVKPGQTLIDLLITGACITAANFSTAGIIKIGVAANDKYTTDVDTVFYTIKLIKADNTKSSNVTLNGDFSDTLKVTAIHNHNYSNKVVSPTCTEKGYTTYTCPCGDSYVGDYTDIIGHSYKAEVTVPATHLSEGVLTYTCSSCGAGYTEVIEKTSEHNYHEEITTPTCTEQGYTTYICKCGESYIGDYIDALGHSFSAEFTVDKEATFTENGSKSKHCLRKGCAEKSEVTIIPKLTAPFEDTDNAKVNDINIDMISGVTTTQLLRQAGEGAVIKDKEGKALSADKLPGTGMTLTLPDGKEYTIVVFGDVEGDGIVTASDARLALRASVNLEKYEDGSAQYRAANVGSEDKLTASDARLILRASVKLENPADWIE